MSNQDGDGNRFTFSTGITVELRRVSPYLLAEVRGAFTRPEPPMQEVSYELGTRLEPNPIDPDYQKALTTYENQVQAAGAFEIVRRGTVLNSEQAQPAVAQLRAEWKARYQVDLSEPDDHLAYLKYLCFGDPDDLYRLVAAIRRLSHPTEAAIAETTATFPGGVQRA